MIGAAAGLVAVAPAVAAGQMLTLRAALARAADSAYAGRIATARARTATGQATTSLAGLLPTLRTETAVERTTDPLSAFGFALEQRRVTPAAFLPATLNAPPATSNVGASVILQQPIFDPAAVLGIDAADKARGAARASARWTRGATSVSIVEAYYGAVLAGERVTTLRMAQAAAEAHVRQAETAHRNGAVTRSDLLLAQVRAGGATAALAGATGDVRVARLALAVAMGTPDDTIWHLPDSLPSAAAVAAIAGRITADTGTVDARADVQAAVLGRDAARAGAAQAVARYLPRMAGFGRVDWNTPTEPFGGRNSWTVGVLVSWAPFAGGAAIGEAQAAAGRRLEAEAAVAATTGEARLESEAARTSLATALLQVATTDSAVAQSAEAHRIISRKYDGGLATISELLDAAAAETSARLEFAGARRDAIVAAAKYRQSRGLDPALLAALDNPSGSVP